MFSEYGSTFIIVGTIIFMFLYGFIKPILFGEKIESRSILINAMCFFVWLTLMKLIPKIA